jgi:type I restriction enzyme M protein
MDGKALRDRSGEVLFIDARKLGRMEDRVHRVLDAADVERIAGAYHGWRGDGEGYGDVAGFCKSATVDEVRGHGFVLTPGRYVGTEAEGEGDEPFEEKIQRLVSTLEAQLVDSARLEGHIRANLSALGLRMDGSQPR